VSVRSARSDRVVVVGASTGGLLAAITLARGGVPVTVLERSPELDPTPRTLIVTNEMRAHLGGLGEHAVLNEIRRFEMSANGTSTIVDLRQPDLIIERAALIRDLSKEAADAGVAIELGRRLVEINPMPRGIALEVRPNGTRSRVAMRASTVIGADGAHSAVARLAGWPALPTVPVIQAVVRLPANVTRTTACVWFRPRLTPYFFWLIPQSESLGALGLIGVHPSEARAALTTFLAEKELDPIEFQAAQVPLYLGRRRVQRRVGEGNVFLVGDAAGQVKTSTVGGLVTGLRGALAVANAVLDGTTRVEMGELRRELKLHAAVRRAIHGFSEEDYARLLGLVRGSTRLLLGEHSRDRASKMVASALRSEPRLALLAARSVLRSARYRP
jgi:digeranylgeranylglycerophospholipid reductase